MPSSGYIDALRVIPPHGFRPSIFIENPMTIYSGFCIGTGHSDQESNSTIGNLGRMVSERSAIVLNGVGYKGLGRDLIGNMFGHGMEDRVRRFLDAATKAAPTVVNLAGHSRGAIICHMIANEIASSKMPALKRIEKINIFAIDPVNMSSHVRRGKHLSKAVKLGAYVGVVMENVASLGIFPATTIKLGVKTASERQKVTFYNLPGTHGSGTQPFTSAIGLACHGMAMRFLSSWGTPFGHKVPDEGQMCNAFARILIENQAALGANGKVKQRMISNDKEGQAMSAEDAKVKWAAVDVGKRRAGVFKRQLAFMQAAGRGAIDYRDTGIFVNEYHVVCFEKAFPQTFHFLRTGSGDPNTELALMQGSYPAVYDALKLQGVI